jgi:hypothetical protein
MNGYASPLCLIASLKELDVSATDPVADRSFGADRKNDLREVDGALPLV